METIKNARNVLKVEYFFVPFAALVHVASWRGTEDSEGVLNGLHNRSSSPKRVIKADLSATKKNDERRAFYTDDSFLRLNRSDRDVASWPEDWSLSFNFRKGKRQKRLLRQPPLPLMPRRTCDADNEIFMFAIYNIVVNCAMLNQLSGARSSRLIFLQWMLGSVCWAWLM